MCVCTYLRTYVHMYVYTYENEMYTCTDTLHYTDNCIMYNSYTHTVRGKTLEWEKIGEFGESWALRHYFTRQLFLFIEYSS